MFLEFARFIVLVGSNSIQAQGDWCKVPHILYSSYTRLVFYTMANLRRSIRNIRIKSNE